MPLKIEYVVLHCTDAEWGNVDSIRRFHVGERKWKDIGYHFVIGNAFPTFGSHKNGRPDPEHDGQVLNGRDLDRDGNVEEEIGAHVEGWNHNSLGVALVGRRGVFTGAQIIAAVALCRSLCEKHGIPFLRVIGHYETGAKKTCPDLDMNWFRERLLEAGL